MSRNLTWAFVSNFFRKSNNYAWSQVPLTIPRHFDCLQRGYASADNISPDLDYSDHQVPTYQDYLDEHEYGREITVRTLMRLLDVTKADAKNATKQWLVLTDLTKYTLTQNFEKLRAAGAFKSLLRQNIYALADNTNNIKTKIVALQQLKLEINYAIPLLQLSATILNLFVYTTKNDRKILPQYNNRLEYLADKLDCHISLICKIISQYPKLLKSDILKVITITELLVGEVGMATEHILADPRIYFSSVEHITERMRRAKAANIQPLKSWVVRCNITIIEKAEKRKQSWDKLVGPSVTLEEYLSKLMDCDIESVEAMIKRDPSIRTIDIEKLTNLLNFLKGCGYTIRDIYRAPRILHFAIEKVKRNYDNWMKHGLGQPVISTLLRSSESFEMKLQSTLGTKEVDPNS